MPSRDDDPGERRTRRAQCRRRCDLRRYFAELGTREHVFSVLRTLDEIAGGVFADLEPARREAAAARLRESGGESLMYLSRIILQCYYRDDRVMRSLGLEPRPPFPKGFEVEQGDWSLLDPVRARPKLYREVP